MTIVLLTVAALALLMVLHVSAVELVAQWLRLRVLQVRLGVGPRLFSVGRVQVRLLPVAGSVRLKDTTADDADPADTDGAWDLAPRWARVLLPLAGPSAVAAVSLALLGPAAFAAFGRGLLQWPWGALQPLSAGQRLIDDYVGFAATRDFAAVLGLVAAKVAALNLLPLPALAGGQALGALLRAPRRAESERPTAAAAPAAWDAWLVPLMIASWAVALGAWLLRG
jgi:membrane-associated protease RseP (regulator of RpoE activity)